VELVSDLDTGASSTFLDYDFLRSLDLLQPASGDYYELARHLGQIYQYVSKPLRVQLRSRTGKIYSCDAMVNCVPEWQASPFVKINPNRVVLVGRDLMLVLKPKVLLDFDALQTEIQSKRTVRAAARKSAKAKSSSTKRRKRS